MKKTKTRQCLKCDVGYEPKYYDVLNAHILVGQGLCPDCSQKKYDAEVAKEKAAQQASIMGTRRRHREMCGIPFKFMNQDFSTFEKGYQDKAFKLCWEYAEKYPADERPTGYKSLLIYGDWGTGKTHLVCSIAHRVLDRWQGGERGCPRIKFVSEPDLFRKIQATFNYTFEEKRYRESGDDIIKGISYCDLLILDDVGKEKRRDMDFVQRTLFAIIDNRYRLQLPMILTANFDVDGLKRHLEEASFDRVFELIKGKYIRLSGKSYRRNN